MTGQRKYSSENQDLGRSLREVARARTVRTFGRQHLARGSDRNGPAGASGGSGSPPSGEGGIGGSASLTGQLHVFWATDAAVDGVQSGHLVDGARLAFDLEDGSGDVNALDDLLVCLFENGVSLHHTTDYSVSGNTVTFVVAPQGAINGACFKAPASTHPA